MKRNFDEQILGLDKQPVRAGASLQSIAKAISVIWPKLSTELQKELGAAMATEAGKPLTLGAACVSVLMGAYHDEQSLPLPDRAKRMQLALRLNDGGEQDLTPEERDMIKPLLIKGFGGVLIPVVVAEMLEKETAPLKAVG